MLTLGIEQTRKLVKAAVESNTPINLIGAPGIGKSTIVTAIAAELGMPLEELILSQCDPIDLGGALIAGDGRADRLPIGPIKAACDKGSILFLDEFSCANGALQGAAMRLMTERRAGDAKLHPKTVIVLAMNPTEQAAGGSEMALPNVSRMTHIKLIPTKSEVQGYLDQLGPEGSTLRTLGVDYSATLEAAPDLLQVEPPPGAASTLTPWACPRSIERALRIGAVLLDSGESDTGELFNAALAGNLGEEAGASYLSIRKIRNDLPSVAEIIKAPAKARLPGDTSTGAAVLGILAQVCVADACAAYVYADRLKDEIQMAAFRVVAKRPIEKHKTSAHYAGAVKARLRVFAAVGSAIRAS